MFLTNYYGRKFTVAWSKGTSEGSHQTWFCNPHLNAIFNEHAKSEVFAPIVAEFNAHANLLRNILNRLYVSTATSKTFRLLFCPLSLTVFPPIPDADQLLIIGGNRKIRILNHITNEVISVLKSGFSPEFLQREIRIRTKFADLPTPELLEVNENEMWIKERYIVGTPLNRITDKRKYDTALDDAFKSLAAFLSKTSEFKRVLPYAEALHDTIYHKAKENQSLLRYGIERVLGMADSVTSLITKISSAEESILFAHSHGDFHPANILLDCNGKLWLIDWEYSKVRQYGYDSLVFLLKSRFPQGFSARVRSILDDKISQQHEGSIRLRKELSDWDNKRKLYLLLFLLEEIDFHLDENSDAALARVTPAFINFTNEIDALMRIFQ